MRRWNSRIRVINFRNYTTVIEHPACEELFIREQHQRRSEGVHGLRQDEPDGCGVDVSDKLRAQVLQGHGRDAVGSPDLSPKGHVTFYLKVT